MSASDFSKYPGYSKSHARPLLRLAFFVTLGAIAYALWQGVTFQDIVGPSNIERLRIQILGRMGFSAAGFILLMAGGFAWWDATRRQHIRKMLTEGTLAEAQIVNSYQNWGVKVNGQPQGIIRFQTDDGQVFIYKTYDPELFGALGPGLRIKIRHNHSGQAIPDISVFQDFE